MICDNPKANRAWQLAKLSDEEIIERLTTIRGVGQCRPDILPVDDCGVRKGFAVTYRRGHMPKPAALLRHGERWRPYRSVASWYHVACSRTFTTGQTRRLTNRGRLIPCRETLLGISLEIRPVRAGH